MKIKNNEVSMKNKINIDDFLLLIYWTKTFLIFEHKEFLFNDLLEQAESYKLLNTPLDIRYHRIDELLIESYKLYNKLKRTEKQVSEVLDTLNLPFLNSSTMKKETDKYKNIFEDLMENYTYTDPEIIGIQKGMLNEILKDCIAIEDYERAANIRDIISSN